MIIYYLLTSLGLKQDYQLQACVETYV